VNLAGCVEAENGEKYLSLAHDQIYIKKSKTVAGRASNPSKAEFLDPILCERRHYASGLLRRRRPRCRPPEPAARADRARGITPFRRLLHL